MWTLGCSALILRGAEKNGERPASHVTPILFIKIILFIKLITSFVTKYLNTISNLNISRCVCSLTCAVKALRCSVILPNNIPSLRGEFLLCYMCSVSTNRMGVFHPARDVCPVCGDFVPFKNHARKAYVCMTHRRHGGMKYCGLCGIILGMMDLSKMPTVTHALLCQQCGFGHETCCHLVTE